MSDLIKPLIGAAADRPPRVRKAAAGNADRRRAEERSRRGREHGKLRALEPGEVGERVLLGVEGERQRV